jgi:hypothetical protein
MGSKSVHEGRCVKEGRAPSRQRLKGDSPEDDIKAKIVDSAGKLLGSPGAPFYCLIGAVPCRYVRSGAHDTRGMIPMKKMISTIAATAILCTVAAIGAAAETAPDKAVLQKATAECKAQVKDYAKYNETSWYARHKMVKKCVKEALAKK